MSISQRIQFILPLFFLHYASLAIESSSNTIGNWQEIKPGGNTMCARGEEFSFFVHPGTVDNIIIDYIGGGACWNSYTCSKDTATFVDSVDYVKERQRKGLEGFYDKSNPHNPIKDWHHIVIPYCTGDIHWGNNDKRYTDENGQTFNIRHRGAINAKSVLNWIKHSYQSPKKILVTGCSAGAYGSIYWLPHITKHFNRSSTYQLADSGAGIVTKTFFGESFSNWKATDQAVSWIPEIDPNRMNWNNLTLHDLYKAIGHYYPTVSLSQYSAAQDTIQKFFYEIMGGNPELWSKKLLASFNLIDNSTENFNFFRSHGENHCILPYDEFYTNTTSGTSFLSWFTNYINDKSVPSIDCVNC